MQGLNERRGRSCANGMHSSSQTYIHTPRLLRDVYTGWHICATSIDHSVPPASSNVLLKIGFASIHSPLRDHDWSTGLSASACLGMSALLRKRCDRVPSRAGQTAGLPLSQALVKAPLGAPPF